MKTMHKLVGGGLVVAMLAASATSVQAGDREWATAGKILTGVAIAGVIHNALTPRCETTTTYVYHQPAPVVVQQPVIVQQPTQVVVQQPVVVHQPQVVHVVQPAPVVVYQPAPVIVRSGPVFYGHYHHHGYGHGHGRYGRGHRH